jgi:uncharacterized delta-60 repeat protein
MKTLLLFFAAVASLAAFAQDGSLDTSFGDNGIVRTDIDGDYDFPTSIAQQTDGNLVVVGSFTNEGHRFPSIVRYLPDGTMDTTFGDNGLLTYSVPEYENEYYEKVLLQSDGKILAGGSFYNSGHFYAIQRFLSDGSIDNSFGINGEARVFPENFQGGNMILQNDDSVLVTGFFLNNGIYRPMLRRILPDGALDLNFGNNGTVMIDLDPSLQFDSKIALTNDGKIMVIVNNVIGNNSTIKMLFRFNSNGVLDTSFGNNGKVTITIDEKYHALNMAVYNDGKIAVYSQYLDSQSSTLHNIYSRYLSNGDLDTSFGNNGYINPDIDNLWAIKILVQDNQRLLVYGHLITNFEEGGGTLYMARYKLGGSVDSSFDFESSSSLYYPTDVLIQNDGKIVCLMTTPWYVGGGEDIIMKRYFNDPLSVPEFENQNITIYPNPSNGIFILKSNSNLNETPYQIIDITGKVISKGKLTQNQAQIDLSTAQSGVYFLKTSKGVFRLLKN